MHGTCHNLFECSVPETQDRPAEATSAGDIAATNPVCSFPGCGRPEVARGLCCSHYQQQRRGQPLKPVRAYGTLTRVATVLRVSAEVRSALELQMKKQGISLYEACRQAVEAGVQSWAA